MQPDFENYNQTSTHYDKTRSPVGLDFLKDVLLQTRVNSAGIAILDAGCGTGSYIEALRHLADRFQGVDLNEGMLARVRDKFIGDESVTLQQGDLTNLPFENESFQVILCNQVLHHLNDTRSVKQNFPNVEKVIQEFSRLLSKQGSIVINTSGQDQLTDGFWWADLIPAAVASISKRFPTIQWFKETLNQHGFEVIEVQVPYAEALQQDHYLDPEGPLKEDYRNGDSTWSLVSQPQLDAACNRLKALISSGEITPYLNERERLRAITGQTTFIHAKKI